MLSIKAKILNESDKFVIKKLQDRYSYARKHLYKHLTTTNSDELEVYIMCKFKMNNIEARSVIREVESLHKKIETNKKETEERIKDIEKLLKEIKSKEKKSKNDKRNDFKLEKNLEI